MILINKFKNIFKIPVLNRNNVVLAGLLSPHSAALNRYQPIYFGDDPGPTGLPGPTGSTFKEEIAKTDEELAKIESIKESIKNCFIEFYDLGLLKEIKELDNTYTISIKGYKHCELETIEDFKLATLYPEQLINEMIIESINKFQIEYPNVIISQILTIGTRYKNIITKVIPFIFES